MNEKAVGQVSALDEVIYKWACSVVVPLGGEPSNEYEIRYVNNMAYHGLKLLQLAQPDLEALRARVERAEAERDEAVNNANAYRERVFDFLDGMTNESQLTQELEESRGLEPVDREQYRRAIEYIRKAFANHNYLTEAMLSGSLLTAAALKGDE